jgi:ribonuclease HII
MMTQKSKPSLLLGGIDEAGRGAILGPLVVAGVLINENDIEAIASFGVKDSKLLTRKKREALYSRLEAISQFEVVRISPREVDRSVLRGSRRRRLNYLETIAMARIITALKPDVVFIDSPDPNLSKFTEEVKSLCKRTSEVVATHKADRLYPLVSAASIVAKVERDWAIDEIESRNGCVGSGYPSDPTTRKFLMELLESKSPVPEFSRISWKTWSVLSESKLDNFIETQSE